MAEQTALSFLDNSIAAAPDNVKDDLVILRELTERRLWHNVTTNLYALVNSDKLNDDSLKQLYQSYIKTIESKINQTVLAKMANRISRTYPPTEGIEFLSQLVTRIGNDETNIEASLYLRSAIVLLSMSLGPDSLEESKKLLDGVEESLKSLTLAPGTLDSAIHSNYYLAQAQFFKMKAHMGEFYKNAMLYLSYTPVEKIPIQQQQSVAYDLGLAALTGEDIYNFGDLLSHPILQSLKGTDKEWLEHILRAFNAGDIVLYTDLANNKYTQILNQEPALQNKANLLKVKIAILSLMGLILDRGSSDRVFGFVEICQRTGLGVDDVELLVMRALSLKLIKGYINQVNQTVVISWVQPRVLGLEDIKRMRDRLEEWRKKVHATLVFVEQQTGELA